MPKQNPINSGIVKPNGIVGCAVRTGLVCDEALRGDRQEVGGGDRDEANPDALRTSL
jgi:hypothetical protein